MRRRIPRCDRFRLPTWLCFPFRGRARLALGVALCLAQGAGVIPGGAALAASKKSASTVLTGPVVLDADGRPLRLPARVSSAAVALQSNRTPSYLAYRVSNPKALDASIPTVVTHSGDKTTGPLYFNPAVKAQLGVALAAGSSVAVNNGKSTTLLQPIPPVFGPGVSNGKVLAWLAAQTAASRSATSDASATTAKGSTTTAQQNLLDPNKILDSITGNSLIKDITSLVSKESSGVAKWNQESLEALKAELRRATLKDVSAHAALTSGTTVAAQELSTASGGATADVQPAPVPEPGSILVFGMAASAIAIRGWRCRRRAT
ncbi:PEP-CTERM sorting domain-containing protein [Aquisphaera insulae]|uniref:PEP-CTERM sorting domain-containing protein n=1 Tax=Aquisphaera insulae TaxID=2712864 RepID=UPI0013EE2B4C|nr:PEP-CTERM sorting domain-containing protein [Aquisphaera insulae]